MYRLISIQIWPTLIRVFQSFMSVNWNTWWWKSIGYNLGCIGAYSRPLSPFHLGRCTLTCLASIPRTVHRRTPAENPTENSTINDTRAQVTDADDYHDVDVHIYVYIWHELHLSESLWKVFCFVHVYIYFFSPRG